MPKFVIERELAGAGKLRPDQLKAISQKSCGVLRELGPGIQWLESFVTDDKLYCIYIAPDEAAVRKQRVTHPGASKVRDSRAAALHKASKIPCVQDVALSREQPPPVCLTSHFQCVSYVQIASTPELKTVSASAG